MSEPKTAEKLGLPELIAMGVGGMIGGELVFFMGVAEA